MKSTRLHKLLLGGIAFLFTVGAAPQDQPKPGTMGRGMAMMQSCAMSVPGADLKVSDTSDGISVAVTTKSGDVAELRRRVEAMAKMHSASSTGPMMQGQKMAFTVKYEEITNGALLILTPKDQAQLKEFRTQVRNRAEQMKKGDCSMMQGMMSGMMGGVKAAGSEPEGNVK